MKNPFDPNHPIQRWKNFTRKKAMTFERKPTNDGIHDEILSNYILKEDLT